MDCAKKNMSKACALLFKLLMDEKSGVQHMETGKIWKSHKCFQDYPLKDFEGYLDDLVKKIYARRKLVCEEEEDFRAYVIPNPRHELTNQNTPF